jgi:hypothetical protein
VFDNYPNTIWKFCLEISMPKYAWKTFSKLVTANGSLYEISNDNGARVINFATSKNFISLTTSLKYYYNHILTSNCLGSPIHQFQSNTLPNVRAIQALHNPPQRQ